MHLISMILNLARIATTPWDSLNVSVVESKTNLPRLAISMMRVPYTSRRVEHVALKV